MIVIYILRCLHGAQTMLAKWALEVIPAETKYTEYLNLRIILFQDFAPSMLQSEI
jgi:hypothetical protein